MSFLFWAFLAGAGLVAFPLVFHLIRRTPKGRQEFSSLMFLKPSPPRLTRRSRLDDILLLLLRAAVILLVAAAFMRPFWRQGADLSVESVRGRRVAILLDTSASMRRGDLWRQAVLEAEQALGELGPADDVALLAFDGDVVTVVGFEDQAGADRSHKPALVRRRIRELLPTWSETDLGAALIRAAEILDESGDREETGAALQVVVISDMQHGSRLDSLQAYEWPPHVRVAVKQVALPDNSNARVQLLASSDEESPGEPKVRVTSAADSTVDQFYVRWAGDDGKAGGAPVAFYVPPGQSRTLSVPRGPRDFSSDRLVVSGDQSVFDNTHYVSPAQQQVIRLVYIGEDAAGDPQGARFFLEQAFEETPARKVELSAYRRGEEIDLRPGEAPHLMVLTSAVGGTQGEAIDRYLAGGGRVLVVLSGREMAVSLGELLSAVELDEPVSAAKGEFRLLGEIDFTHPLFAPFAGPRYNDFTGVRFWAYRPVSLREESPAHVVASFDNGRPAMWEQPYGEGTVYVLTSGWQPAESQLALSSKFVPLLEVLIEQCTDRPLPVTSYFVGDAVPLPTVSTEERRTVRQPGGGELAVAGEAGYFDDTDQPGIYTLSSGGGEHPFAVNLAAGESDTAPLEVEQLEQLGVMLGTQTTRQDEYERLRQLRDVELEDRQKIWKWLIVAALAFAGVEMCLAGWRAHRASQTASGEAI